MSKVLDSKAAIQLVFMKRLKLQTPVFQLELDGAKVCGVIISPSFRGMPDSERQRQIWDALHEEFGAEAVRRTGVFLAFTPDEWNIDEDSVG